jgi:tryptophanyl-tRNA synthetase
MQKRIVSGIQSSGKLHFGNYFGAMRQNIELANSGDYEAFIFIADLHALTTVKNKKEMEENINQLVAAYIACGLDIEKCTFFKQSDVSEHAELSTILNNVVTMPYLMRAHAYKDHEAKSKEVNLGLFTYPVLMAADILLYDADLVPVGKDQKQHVEYARDIAGYYNRAWEVEDLKLPTEYIKEDVSIIPGVDGEKMSKSKGNVIALFSSEAELKSSIMSIVTDSKSPSESKDPVTNNIYNIHKHFLSEQELITLRDKFVNSCELRPYGYGQAKQELLESILKWREGKTEIYNSLVNNSNEIKVILNTGKLKAKKVAELKMEKVKKSIGIN